MAINAFTGTFVPGSRSYTETWEKRTAPTAQGTSNFACSEEFSGKKSVGSDIPDYHKKIKSKELLPVTNWHQFETSSTYNGTLGNYEYIIGGVTHYAYYHDGPFQTILGNTDELYLTEEYLASLIDPDKLDNAATKAAVKLTASKHDTLTFIAELRKTIEMFKGFIKRLVKKMSRSLSKDWASLWLEGRYGWRTLWYDLNSINKAINHLSHNSKSGFWRAIGVDTDTWVDDTNFPLDVASNKLNTRRTRTVNISYRGSATGLVKPPSFGGDILVTAWELTPWSVFIDWVVDIGLKLQYLSNFSAAGDASIGASVKVDVHSKSVSSLITPNAGDGYVFHPFDIVAESTASLVSRKPHIPSYLPNLDVNIDFGKGIDLIALLLNLLEFPVRDFIKDHKRSKRRR